MLSLMMGMMVMGCDDGNKEQFDPTEGRTIEEKYRGTYTTELRSDVAKIELSTNKVLNFYKDRDNITFENEPDTEYWAYTDGINLYQYSDIKGRFWIAGVFQDDSSFLIAFHDTEELTTELYIKIED